MAIPIGLTRKAFHIAEAEFLKAVGRSGAVEKSLSNQVPNPTVELSHKLFSSPSKKTASIELIHSTSIS